MTGRGARSIIVLGGGGFVGSALVEAGLRLGHRVRSVGRADYEASRGLACDVLINANGNSRKFLAAEDPTTEFDLSVRSVQRSLHDFRYGRYVYLSTIDVYYPDVASPALAREERAPDLARLSPYGFHKYLAEQLVRHDAPRRLILRMGGFVGRGLWKNPIHDLLTGAPLRVHPDSEYQYMDTADFARIVFDRLERDDDGGAEILNVAGDGVVALREVASWIPGCRPPADADALPRERYEVSLEKLRRLADVPATRDAVRRFVREWPESGGRTA